MREPDLDGRVYAELVRRCVRLAEGTKVRILVNDRLDVALAAGAHGVHLREDSISVEAARRLAPRPRMVGRSVHAAATAARVSSADYLIAGSVFETASKPGAPAAVGLDGLRTIVEAANCPVWAVGGITAGRASAVRACGVAGVAAIGAFLPPAGAADLAHAVQQRVQDLRFSFDTTAQLP